MFEKKSTHTVYVTDGESTHSSRSTMNWLASAAEQGRHQKLRFVGSAAQAAPKPPPPLSHHSNSRRSSRTFRLKLCRLRLLRLCRAAWKVMPALH